MKLRNEAAPNIGDEVDLVSIIVANSEFAGGSDAYCIEFDRKGRPHREWVLAADFEEED